MSEPRQKRQYLIIRNKAYHKPELNLFLQSHQFLYRNIVGLLGGTIAAVYRISPECVVHYSMLLPGWVLIPLMTGWRQNTSYFISA